MFSEQVYGKSVPSEKFFAANPSALEYLQIAKQDAFVKASETCGEMSLNEFLGMVERGERQITDIKIDSYSGMVISFYCDMHSHAIPVPKEYLFVFGPFVK